MYNPMTDPRVTICEGETEEEAVEDALEQGWKSFFQGNTLEDDETKEIRYFIEKVKIENGKLKLLWREEIDGNNEIIAREVFDTDAPLSFEEWSELNSSKKGGQANEIFH